MAFNVFMMRSTIFYDVKGKDRWGWVLTTSDPSADLKILPFPTKEKAFKAVSVARKYLRLEFNKYKVRWDSFKGFVGAILVIIGILNDAEYKDAFDMVLSTLKPEALNLVGVTVGLYRCDLEKALHALER